MRILVLTAGFGEGHNAAARALATAIDANAGEGSAKLVDAFALAAPRLNAVVRKSYLALINRAPGLWNAAYRWLDRSPAAEKVLWLLRGEIKVLAALIEHERPDVLCSTYPMYAFMLREIARQGGRVPPHYNIVTDSISINSLWWRAGGDGWFVPNEDSAEVMGDAGVDRARLHVLGFPVARFFGAHAGQLTPPDLAHGCEPRVLYVVNSGTPAAAETARRLLTDTDWEVTCTVGRNEGFAAELRRLAISRRPATRILGWTDQIPRLLMTHHVVISKAGGATTQESLAARCPMIVNQIVPGQEEGNYELLRRHGIGALATTPAEVLRQLGRAFANRGAVWREWRMALGPLSRPEAAADIATMVINRTAATRSGASHAAADGRPSEIPPHVIVGGISA